MKIAVCVINSLDSKNIQKFCNYFKNTEENTYDFFYHTFSIPADIVKIEETNRTLNSVLFGTNHFLDIDNILHRQTFYSLAKVLNFKKQIELNNNFVYDIVICTNFDVKFTNNQFEIDQRFNNAYKDLDLFTLSQDRILPYNRLAANIDFIYGSSYCMDMLTSMFGYLVQNKTTVTYDFNMITPSIILQDFCNEYNIKVIPGIKI